VRKRSARNNAIGGAQPNATLPSVNSATTSGMRASFLFPRPFRLDALRPR
jgi:hypothetical protein